MKTNPTFTVRFASWSLLAAMLGCSSFSALADDSVPKGFVRIPPDTDDWTRHFSLGTMVAFNVKADFRMSGAFTLSGNNPAQGIYDDGYVRTDNTGNSGGYTSNWGYNNASQYNAAAQTLTMHSASSFSTAGSASDDADLSPSLELSYGMNLWYWKHARVGLEAGFGWLPISIVDRQTLVATVNQSSFTYSTAGIVVPGAPYSGGPSGGPLISDTFTSTSTQSGGTVSGSRKLDLTLYTLRLGPSFYWDLSDHLGMSLGAGPVVGLVDGAYRYNEIVTANGVSSGNTGSIGTTGVVFGGYVNATLLIHVTESADVYIGAQFMPMTSTTITGSGRQAKLDLGGQARISAGINWPF